MKILFVCTGNTCRSVMAEAYFNHKAKNNNKEWYAKSAGISAVEGEKVSENAVKAMNELFDVDISEKTAVSVNEEILHESDYILTMTNVQKDFLIISYPEQEEKIFLLTQFIEDHLKTEQKTGISDENEHEETNIHDPWGAQVDHYKKIAIQIAVYVDRIIADYHQ